MVVRSLHRNSLVVAATLGLALGACNDGKGTQGLIDRGSCDVLIECAAALAPDARDEYEQAYGAGGTCWQSGPANWATCREACVMALDAINALGRISGESCGTCSSDADCSEFGAGATCNAGLCSGGDGMAEGESGGDGDGDGGDGDGDDPFAELEAVSILLVVDNSGSMGWHQQLLALDADNLVAPLDAAGIPWRIGITTTDNGNPWCQAGTTTPEGGKLVFSSCRSRLDDFLFADVADARGACDQQCDTADITPLASATAFDSNPSPRPWIESVNGETNLPGTLSVTEALHCLVPQGINGCGFESQLESANLALARARSDSEASYGFTDESRLTVVLFLSDEVDCSYNKEWETIFDANGNKAFWSDPNDPYPTSAVCWNAGVQCEEQGAGGYDCIPADKDVNGALTQDSSAAVLHPVARFIEGMHDAGPVVAFGILGVDQDGEPGYFDSPGDPGFQDNFGIGPGCTRPDVEGDVTAVPPVRMWSVLQQVGPESGQAAYSICEQNYSDALTEIGLTIASYFD